MKNSIFETFSNLEYTSLLSQKLSTSERNIYISGLHGSSRNFLTKNLSDKFDKIILLCDTIQQVNETKVELDILGLGLLIIPFDETSLELLQERLKQVKEKEKFIIVSTYDIFKLRFPDFDSIERNTLKLFSGSETDYEEVIEFLKILNFQSEKFVESIGEFAVRGSIIDFWSFSEKQPVRIEFDGDFIESIRFFDPESQRSAGLIQSVTIASSIESENVVRNSTIFDIIHKPLILGSELEIIKNTENKKEDPDAENFSDIDKELFNEIFDDAVPEEKKQKTESRDDKILKDFLFNNESQWIIESLFEENEKSMELNITEPPSIRSSYEILSNVLIEYSQKNYEIVITTENEIQAHRLKDLLSDYKNELAELISSKKVEIIDLPIKSGFILKDKKLLVLTDYQIFNKPYRTKLTSPKKNKKSVVKTFSSLKRGDFVVHENFGIGQYSGLENIKIGDITQESIKILYAEGGVVYVNLNYLSLVKKYSANENVIPKLSILGSGEWVSTKKKAKAKIKEAAKELIELYAKRKASVGHKFSYDTIWQTELEASFIYEDTPDQSKVTEEIKNDMESENPMDRLVCGDVGFGKTEVAVRAAFKAAIEGKQTAVLVPTTILAQQHYNTFKDRLSSFTAKVEVLSRFQNKSKQIEIVNELKEGKVDVVIGTHRLLSKDIEFKDLGLLIIDEEHRFGVQAKEKIRSFKANVDTLALTATPIPRTLNLSLLGARDLSIIATPPPNRQPIYTKVETFNIAKIREWIQFELQRNGQVYFVHDRIQSIDKIASYIQKHIPNLSIGIAHGQMKPQNLEQVIYDFLNKKFQMLISTKIIESGIDIPSVNTIIVNRADRFGLAELHQLRGRVGRSDRQAYAYFIIPSKDYITKKAARRLQAVEEFSDLGEGFNLSMRDLEIRGAGNLLGMQQSGFINNIGFDLYIKLLDESVEELKQKEFREVFDNLPKQTQRTDPTIDTFFEIGIPKEYMPEQSDRLGFYTAMFSLKNLQEAEEIMEEMIDRFGKPPVVVNRLFATALLKYYASYALFDRVIIQRENIFLILPKGDNKEYYEYKFQKLMDFIMKNYPKEIKFNQQKEVLKLSLKNHFGSPEKAQQYLIELFKSIAHLINEIELNSGKNQE